MQRSSSRRFSQPLFPFFTTLALLALFLALLTAAPARASQVDGASASVVHLAIQGGEVYTNPLPIDDGAGGAVETCADPTILYGQEEEGLWYMFCTSDPLSDDDRDENGFLIFHKIPMFSSTDLVNWSYEGDAFDAVPEWGAPTAGLWAPELTYFNGQYYLYYTMTDVADDVSGVPNCGGDSAIGVATSDSPLGPWEDSGAPAVAPRSNGADCNFFWTFDPDVLVNDAGENYLYYGSYYGGIQVRPLSEDGLTTDPASAVQVTIANRYEGPEVVEHDGYYYLFASATDCCRGPLTGYSVFAGRSTDPTGPFEDRDGASLLAGRVGGTPVISMNGNRWVGTGHNSVFTDFDGQTWTMYHAIDRLDSQYYFTNPGDPNLRIPKRPALLDPVDWLDGWPTVRGNHWASDEPMPAPAAQPGETTAYTPNPLADDAPGAELIDYSDEFTDTLGEQWSWAREPAADTFGIEEGRFRFETQDADLYEDNNSASILLQDAPTGDFVVETHITTSLPAEGCCFNYRQAGLVIRADDDNYIKLVEASIWETRQVEFAKEISPTLAVGYARYGNTVVGAPGADTFLRIVRRAMGDEQHYTAYSSVDGVNWVRGGTWAHDLGDSAEIGLVSMGGPDFEATFEYVRVYELAVPTAVTLSDMRAAPTAPRLGLATAALLMLMGAGIAFRRRAR